MCPLGGSSGTPVDTCKVSAPSPPRRGLTLEERERHTMGPRQEEVSIPVEVAHCGHEKTMGRCDRGGGEVGWGAASGSGTALNFWRT